ncbi:MAG: hypothetical protein ABJB33_02595 [Gemmatimonadota bacterium]
MAEREWQTRSIRLKYAVLSHAQAAADLGISRQRVAALCRQPGAPVDPRGRPIIPEFNLWYMARRLVAAIRRRQPTLSPLALAAQAVCLAAVRNEPRDLAESLPWVAAAVAAVVFKMRVRQNDDGIFIAIPPKVSTVAVPEVWDED